MTQPVTWDALCRHWTLAEQRILAETLSVRDLARKLGRPVAAVLDRLLEMDPLPVEATPTARELVGDLAGPAEKFDATPFRWYEQRRRRRKVTA